MFERFSDRSRGVMQTANEEARRFGHEYIGTEHILLGLAKQDAGVARVILMNLGAHPATIIREVSLLIQSGAGARVSGRMPQTPRAKKVIEYAIDEARRLGHNYIGTEHLLLGLLREEEGVASHVLMNLGLTLDAVREQVRVLSQPGDRPAASPEPQPLVVSDSPSALLTAAQAESLRQLIRELTEKKEWFVRAQDFEQASRCRDAARTLQRVLNQLQGGSEPLA